MVICMVLCVQVVTPQELSRLHHVLQQEAACMAVMLSNACMVHKLVSSGGLCCRLSVSRQIKLHSSGKGTVSAKICGALCSWHRFQQQ